MKRIAGLCALVLVAVLLVSGFANAVIWFNVADFDGGTKSMIGNYDFGRVAQVETETDNTFVRWVHESEGFGGISGQGIMMELSDLGDTFIHPSANAKSWKWAAPTAGCGVDNIAIGVSSVPVWIHMNPFNAMIFSPTALSNQSARRVAGNHRGLAGEFTIITTIYRFANATVGDPERHNLTFAVADDPTLFCGQYPSGASVNAAGFSLVGPYANGLTKVIMWFTAGTPVPLYTMYYITFLYGYKWDLALERRFVAGSAQWCWTVNFGNQVCRLTDASTAGELIPVFGFDGGSVASPLTYAVQNYEAFAPDWFHTASFFSTPHYYMGTGYWTSDAASGYGTLATGIRLGYADSHARSGNYGISNVTVWSGAALLATCLPPDVNGLSGPEYRCDFVTVDTGPYKVRVAFKSDGFRSAAVGLVELILGGGPPPPPPPPPPGVGAGLPVPQAFIKQSVICGILGLLFLIVVATVVEAMKEVARRPGRGGGEGE